MKCEIEIFIKGQWQHAASFTPEASQLNRGYRGKGLLCYEIPFVGQFLEASEAAISCRYPVNFEHHYAEHWPPFLLDILPSGAGRRYWLQQLNLADGASVDWELLIKGAGNPPGNIRIANAAPPPTGNHPGFTYQEVVERGEYFIEYAQSHGAPVSGSSGAQGDAPKFLLTQNGEGNWHADGALPDCQAAKHWLVKYPRGKQPTDYAVLRNERAYYEVARELGLRVGAPLQFDNNALFIPRFDRETSDNGVMRHGLESLCSLAGIAEFGASPSQNLLLDALARYSSCRDEDLKEFIYRDILNVAMGNTDNHPRNSAVIKTDKQVRLSPLFDFAPMILDDQGIARCCRWEGDAEEAGRPEWGRVAELLQPYGIDSKLFRKELRHFAEKIILLPKIMQRHGVDEDLIERLQPRVDNVYQSLRRAAP